MGQRLVITIKNNEKEIATIYYHWSAYTVSALLEAKELIGCIFNHKDETEKELKLRLIRFCEENGGGISGEDYEFAYIRKMYPNEEFKIRGYSRSRGLISLSEKGMQEAHDWSEGDMTIDLDTETVENAVFCWHEYIEEYNQERKEWDDDFNGYKLEDLKDIGYDIGSFGIECIDDIIAALENVDGVCRFGSEIFELIE